MDVIIRFLTVRWAMVVFLRGWDSLFSRANTTESKEGREKLFNMHDREFKLQVRDGYLLPYSTNWSYL